jgi:hypothetical protein
VTASPAELLALVCGRCGCPLTVDTGAALYPCQRCGCLWEAAGSRLVERPAGAALPTSRLPLPPEILWLAVWRFRASIDVRAKRCASGAPPGAVWDAVRKTAGALEPAVYVPVFDLRKAIVGRLGRTLVEGQPVFDVTPGVPSPSRSVYPVLLGEKEAGVVAEFVYLALEAANSHELRGIDFELTLGPADLVFLPATLDARAVRDASWRFLFREFDSLVV